MTPEQYKALRVGHYVISPIGGRCQIIRVSRGMVYREGGIRLTKREAEKWLVDAAPVDAGTAGDRTQTRSSQDSTATPTNTVCSLAEQGNKQ